LTACIVVDELFTVGTF